MAYSGPACAVPNIASTPKIGFGSGGALSCASLGAALRGLGYGCLGSEGPLGLGAGASEETSGSLGTLAGVRRSCINQIPPTEPTISPPIILTILGVVVSGIGGPLALGAYTPCAIGNGFGGYGALGFANPGRCGSVSYASSGPAVLGVSIPLPF